MTKFINDIFWKQIHVKFLDRRRRVFLVPLLLFAVLLLLSMCWWFTAKSSKTLTPSSLEQSLQHYRRNRNLQHYMSNIQVLIEPSSTPCGSLDKVSVIILVASAPYQFDQRQAVRKTWAKYQPTYFVLGLYGYNVDERLVDNYIEAKQYSDLIVFEFRDHYQNLTLKTALMMQWTLDRCPQAQFLFKTDDDVMVNPWTLGKVVKENGNAQLIGYSHNDTHVYRETDAKWHIPRWLLPQDRLPVHLAGPGYLINGNYIQRILEKAYQVPMINIEDVYYTYLVAHKELGLTLTHDGRLNQKKPWLKISCVYWGLASVHSLAPEEMLTAWSKIESLVDGHNNTDSVCQLFNSYLYYFSDQLLY